MSNYKEKNADSTYIDPKEFAVAEKEADNSGYSYTHKFIKPFSYDGKTYTELSFYWDRLTGRDSLAIENEMQLLGKTVVVHALSSDYLIRMAARACSEKIGIDAFDIMSIRDFNKIRSAARSFLLKSE
ncbi:MAG: phage tail assembly protein [Papillibacter sp.]|nr:phage tail assembly protein [Papillibacter sp.]